LAVGEPSIVAGVVPVAPIDPSRAGEPMLADSLCAAAAMADPIPRSESVGPKRARRTAFAQRIDALAWVGAIAYAHGRRRHM